MNSIADNKSGVNRKIISNMVKQDAGLQSLVLHDVNDKGKERPWRRHKMNNEKLYELVSTAEPPIYTSNQLLYLKECGNDLIFSRLATGKLKLKAGNFCKIRLCPLCTWRRSLKLFCQISQITEHINNKQNVGYIFTTLTIKNCGADELPKTIDKLNAGFKKLTGNGGKRNKNLLSEMLVGYLKVMEFTYNQQEKTFHPHLHCIFVVKLDYFKGKNYLSKSKLSDLWGRCLGVDYNPSIDVKRLKDISPKAIAEVAKYPVKLVPVFSLHDTEAVEVIRVLKNAMTNRRLITFGGIFKKVKQELNLIDVEKDNNLVNVGDSTGEEKEIEEVRYTWCAGFYFKVAD